MRRHLRCIGLQRVVQHVETGADDGDRKGDAPGRRCRGGQREGGGERDAAGQHETPFAEARDERPHRRGIDEAADAERGEEEADLEIAQGEFVPEVGAEIDEGAEEEECLDEGGEDDDPHPRDAQQCEIAGDQRAAVAHALLGDAWRSDLDGEERGDDEIERAEHDEDAAPADGVAKEAAEDLAEDDAEDLPGEETCERRLALLVSNDVAEIGDGERDDGAGGGAAQEAQRAEHREAAGEGTGTSGQAGEQRRHRDHRIFAEAITERPDEDLAQPVGDGEIGRDHRGAAGGRRELAGDLRQQRIGDPQRCRRGEGGGAQQDDRADGRRGSRFGHGRRLTSSLVRQSNGAAALSPHHEEPPQGGVSNGDFAQDKDEGKQCESAGPSLTLPACGSSGRTAVRR